jgi:EAL domain-containing protein (putative c-di-GMP-specific phosphodiesterase class I)/ActR/RegA family two-component response regulator
MAEQPEHAEARLLVVDDEEPNLVLLRHMLARAGYRHIETIADSSTVMARVVSEHPDLVLLDLHMPEPDGFTLLREIAAVVPHDDILPVLVLTADITIDSRELALGHGALDLLTKPFYYPELLLRVHNLLSVRAIHTRVRRHDAEVTSALAAHTRAAAIDADRRRAISARVDDVVSGTGLTIVFQPVIDLVDGAVVGAEALSRFTTAGSSTPDVWFLEADEIGRRVEAEVVAVRRAVERLDELPSDAFLSINACAETIGTGAMAAALTGVSGFRIVVELTEHESIDDYPALLAGIDELRERGVRLAVDDTGSGFSGLKHILRLSPDIIKLDRSLVAGVDADPSRRSLMAAMVHFANETGTMLVGEGIETEGELAVLRSLGLGHGQGYLLARPGSLPLTVADVPGLRSPPPPRPSPLRTSERSLGDVLHDGPVQELSAACLRLQLLQTKVDDGPTNAELAVVIGNLRRSVAQLSEIGARMAGSEPAVVPRQVDPVISRRVGVTGHEGSRAQ